jgi:hypothetical protein
MSITVYNAGDKDFISLTDMLRAKDGDFFIADWLRNRNTVEFLGIWKPVHNPNFNYGGFAIIKSQAGLNNYKLSAKEWVVQTNAIGLVAKAGRSGGTYAHQDIAFEFGMWISAKFKIYLIKEFQRLKETERVQLGWDIRRNPDALACVVNLSNDGIFTPPEQGGCIQRVGSDKTGHWQIIESAL